MHGSSRKFQVCILSSAPRVRCQQLMAFPTGLKTGLVKLPRHFVKGSSPEAALARADCSSLQLDWAFCSFRSVPLGSTGRLLERRMLWGLRRAAAESMALARLGSSPHGASSTCTCKMSAAQVAALPSARCTFLEGPHLCEQATCRFAALVCVLAYMCPMALLPVKNKLLY